MADEYATLRAAEAAGARIQAWTLEGVEDDNGQDSLEECAWVPGYWRTLEEPAQWTCHPSRYRVEPQA